MSDTEANIRLKVTRRLLLITAFIAAPLIFVRKILREPASGGKPRRIKRTNEIFYSDFRGPDPRWETRTSDPTAADRATTWDEDYVTLRVKPDEAGFVTGVISTKNSFRFTYGHVEARMKFMSPEGALACLWLQDPTPNEVGGSEVDIAECGGTRNVWHNVYWRTEENLWPAEPNETKDSTRLGDQANWHVYGLDWLPDRYDFTIDGIKVATITDGLSDHPKYLVLSTYVRDWQAHEFNLHDMWTYRTRIDWIRVMAN